MAKYIILNGKVYYIKWQSILDFAQRTILPRIFLDNQPGCQK